MSYLLNRDEQAVWEAPPAIRVNRNTSLAGKIMIGILVLIGLGTLLFYGLGVIFFIIAGVYYFRIKLRKNPFESLYYILTNQRALLLDTTNKGRYTVAQECNLSKVVAIAQNKTNVSNTNLTARGPQNTISNVVGDVAFLEGTNLRLKFEHVVDPDSLVQTVNEIKKSSFVGP